METLHMVSRFLCRLSAIVFVGATMMAPVGASECSEHSECGSDVYCIEGECTTCFADPDVCLDAEFCQYPDECFCNSGEAGVCTEALDCLTDGYPQSGLGYCDSCDDIWQLCPTRPTEYWCSWNNECITDGECTSASDCPNPFDFVCTQWGECVPVG